MLLQTYPKKLVKTFLYRCVYRLVKAGNYDCQKQIWWKTFDSYFWYSSENIIIEAVDYF